MNDLQITKGQILRYSLLPQILPRAGKLLGSGFANLSYFIVVVLNTLQIIPNGHPYLRRDQHGRYSIFQALAAGANYIPFNKKNIDKIFMFGTLLVGMIMLMMQCVLMVAALFTGKAFAYQGPGLGPRATNDFLGNENPEKDIAFQILDLVFGVPDIYNSSYEGTTSFHAGLHALFEFYSYGILLVGTFVIIYLTMTVVMETAQTGIPFGRRFEKAWAPIRLILFFGLLLPATHGLNLAQYLVLESARLGSNVATNAWITFDKAAKTPYIGNADQLVATPETPELTSYAGFMALARVCSWAEGRARGIDVRPYLSYGAGDSVDISTSVPAFSEIVEKLKGGTILIRFGVKDDKYKSEAGGVFATCGELAMPIVDQSQPGAAYIQQAYLETIPCLWSGTASEAISCSQHGYSDMGQAYTSRYTVIHPYDPFPNMDPYRGQTQKTQFMILLNQDVNEAVKKGIEKQIDEGEWNNDPALVRGWAGAGIWFNKIAEQNGAITSAVHAKPTIKSPPYVMQYIKDEKLREDQNTPFSQLYKPFLSTGKKISFEEPQDADVSRALEQLFSDWGNENTLAFFKDIPETHNNGGTGNVIIDTINAFMGTKGLFDMCRNADVNPLAQLSSLGRGLIEHAISSFGVAIGVGALAGIASILQVADIAGALAAGTKFFITFGSIGLMLGFVLFYVVPFLPFIYFFFAVMTWVKSIFEAMVGMPLWALAHLKIDGDGMPGDAATSGYFHILEIFLRPIFILIGFLAGIVIFMAMARVLNEIFYLVLSNLAGHPVTEGTTDCFAPPASADAGAGGGGGDSGNTGSFKRGPIDEFFYTVIYTIIIYMMALPCFKLVDLIPDNVMRWLGAGISTFGSQDGDPAAGLMRNVSAGAGLIGSNFTGGLRKLGFG